ncbi:hypothetical protein EBU71_12450, partial [bacterium]|nr:hypothetical protein [Candidatus Elulimicrobium humile]
IVQGNGLRLDYAGVREIALESFRLDYYFTSKQAVRKSERIQQSTQSTQSKPEIKRASKEFRENLAISVVYIAYYTDLNLFLERLVQAYGVSLSSELYASFPKNILALIRERVIPRTINPKPEVTGIDSFSLDQLLGVEQKKEEQKKEEEELGGSGSKYKPKPLFVLNYFKQDLLFVRDYLDLLFPQESTRVEINEMIDELNVSFSRYFDPYLQVCKRIVDTSRELNWLQDDIHFRSNAEELFSTDRVVGWYQNLLKMYIDVNFANLQAEMDQFQNYWFDEFRFKQKYLPSRTDPVLRTYLFGIQKLRDIAMKLIPILEEAQVERRVFEEVLLEDGEVGIDFLKRCMKHLRKILKQIYKQIELSVLE